MTLTQLVAQEKWQEFDEEWTALVASKGPIDDLVAALKLAAEKRRLPRCLPMVKDHAAALVAAGKPADGARLLGTALAGGGAPGELIAPLYDAAAKAWSTETWWAPYTEIAGLRPDNHEARAAWTVFERLLGFEEKRLVFHSGGWGVGEVTQVDRLSHEVEIRFLGGRKDRFPLSAAVEIFEILPEEDLRSLAFRSPEAMRKRLKDDPLGILRAILERHGGRSTNASVKNALLQVGIEGSAWSSWWKRARKLAEESEWFRVTGTPARGEIQLLRSAADPVAELRKLLENVRNFEDLLTRIRDQLIGGESDDRVRAMMLEILEKRASDTAQPEPLRLAAWLLVRDDRTDPPAPILDLMRAVAARPLPADGSGVPPLWALFQGLPSTRDQERCVQALQDLYGDGWLDEAARHLQHAPTGMVRPLVEALLGAGRGDDLARHYRELLARPLRAPDVFIQLGRLAESGRLAGEWPAPVLRAQSFLALASWLHINRKGDAALCRTQTRLAEFLTKGKPSVLRRLLENVEHEGLLGLQKTMQRGVDETIDRVFTNIVVHAAPPSIPSEQAPFWETDRIWTTREGLERRRAELRVLHEVKIPANQDAIGRAAAMGDLSENSEWEMAIEEQRKLTDRASQIEAELRSVELLENAILPENTVCPGSFVRYRHMDSTVEHEIEILGPWDTEKDHVVSYRAPLAAGLLGRKPGERAKINLPSGELEVEVLAARPADLG